MVNLMRLALKDLSIDLSFNMEMNFGPLLFSEGIVEPKFTSHSDPASQWTAARKGPAFFAYSTNYLIDTDHSVIMDVEGTRSIRQVEVGSVRTMLDRIKE